MTLTARQLRQPPTIKAIERVPYFADVYILLVRVYLQNVYQLYPSLYWLLEVYYYIIVALISIDPSPLDIYKEEINIFSNKLASILP